MRKFIYSTWSKAIISGILTIIAMTQQSFVLGWLCYIPLFMSLNGCTPKQAFKLGAVLGLAMSFIGFYWMIPGSERFTGNSIWYGVIVFFFSSLFIALFFGFIIWCFTLLKAKENNWKTIVHNGLLLACLYCIAEALLMFVAAGLPWFDFHSGYALTDNLYAIQWASLFGIHGITFFAILVNYLFACFIVQKQWQKLLIPAGVVAAYLLTGFILLQSFEGKPVTGKPVKIAILSENIPPEMKWDDNTGNLLVNRLLDMNRTAVNMQPDIALWSESAIPWTYKPNDDLVNAVLKITSPANITHIMGINTEFTGNVVFNSAYCILPNGKVTGRYDKQFLLSFIEKPLDGLLIPFFSSKGFLAKNGQYGEPLNTPYGKAGIIICNETAVPGASYNMVNKGAKFILNLSNDGWFSDTYIVGLHFYNARLRAVETRKDVAINSNNGLSGLIKASGRIAMERRSDNPYIDVVSVQPNSFYTLSVTSPNAFIYLCTTGLLLFIVSKLFVKKTDLAS